MKAPIYVRALSPAERAGIEAGLRPSNAFTLPLHLRIASGRPVSQVTTDFLEWLCEQAQAQGKQTPRADLG